jgi:6-phosphogluconolactonase
MGTGLLMLCVEPRPGVELHQYPDLEALSLAAAAWIVKWARDSLSKESVFTWVLSGGQSPVRVYELLGNPSFCNQLAWDRIHLFWADERCVPLNHPDSNFRMAQELLISKVPIPVDNVHPIVVQGGDPMEAARGYEQHLRGFFQRLAQSRKEGLGKLGPTSFPGFHLVLLGMGPDGHIASLFPGEPALEERRRLVAAVPEARGTPQVPRVTLTLPVLNLSRIILVLVAGKGKLDVLRAVLGDSEGPTSPYPAARLRPRGRLIWLLDRSTLGL